ncbi:unnamed protein product [Ilex paraguariensis]|uniref:Uncharacterized protein n=1 Tax=Ilex paraguariensis TaxID=185542 RepID=A0ABC8TQE2_9AQUA
MERSLPIQEEQRVKQLVNEKTTTRGMEKRTNPPDKGYWSDKGSSMSVRCGRSDSKWMDKNFVEDFEPNSSDEDYVDQIFRRKPKGKIPLSFHD